MTLAKRAIRGFGWKPDLPDVRDYCFTPPRGVRVPTHVDLRLSPAMPEIWDQGNYGSCTGHNTGAALAFAHNIATAAKDPNAFMPSRFFIYRGERVIEGDVAQDAGAEIRDGFKVIATMGAPDEKLYPYDDDHFNRVPTTRVMTNAAKHKATKYRRVDSRTSTATLAALAAGTPVAFGFTVYSEMENDAVARTGVLPMPGKGSQVLGGHAVLAVGYDKRTKRLIVRNSWGTSWGQDGYFTMPFGYAFNTNLADDFWVCEIAA